MKRYYPLILVTTLLLSVIIVTSRAEIFRGKNGTPESLFVTSGPQLQTGKVVQAKPLSSKAHGFAESAPLKEMPEAKFDKNGSSQFGENGREINEQNALEVRQPVRNARTPIDPLVQRNSKGLFGVQSPSVMPTPAATFEGLSSQDNVNAYAGSTVMPPDTNGAVGPTQYVETTNILFQVYSKAGSPLLAGGRKYSQLFSAINDPCANSNDGDPVVLYDQMADRWMISQFCVSIANPNNHQLIAISKTGDATGAYFLYDYMMPNNKFNDYPHFGIWPDGYYMTDHQFNQAGTVFLGAGAFAFDRAKMLVGDPTAGFVYFDYANIDLGVFGHLAGSVDGLVPPPVGTPNMVCHIRATVFGDSNDAIRCFEFRPDFATPANSTYTQIADIPLATYDPRNPSGRADIEQPAPALATENLDSIGNRIMARLSYHNLGTPGAPINSYTFNIPVNVSGVTPTNGASYQAGIRWGELRRDPSTGAMSVRDQGTYVNGAINGATGENDWLGSIAQDNQGNIALGFSASGTGLMPTIKWAGRTGAPSGTLDQGEATVFSSTGVQDTTNSRWGDYSGITLDPTDDCTFWFANEYRLAANSGTAGINPFLWNTRIGSFKFPSCTTSPRGTIQGTVTSSMTGLPIQNAVVTTADGYTRVTDASGNYSITPINPASYTMTASARGGFTPQTVPGVTVANAGTTVQNFVLGPAADISLGPVTITEGTSSNGNTFIEPGETGNIVVQLNDPSTTPASNVQATLTLKDNLPGISITNTAFNYGNIAGSGNSTNTSIPFKLIVGNQVPCGTVVNFVLKVSFGGGTSPVAFAFSTTINCQCSTATDPPIVTSLDATAPPAGSNYTASTGVQNGRLGRTATGSVCGVQKANPGIFAGSTARREDAYVYTNNTAITQCVTVSLSQGAGVNLLQSVAYNQNGLVIANPAANYLADSGSAIGDNWTYSFNVPARQQFTIVVNEASANGTTAIPYTLGVSRLICSLPPVHKPSNFDTDSKTDVTVFRPTSGIWISRSSATSGISSRTWGAANDKPVPGDYDGDGQTDLAVYRKSEGNWYILNSASNTITVRNWGTSTDTPAPADYDGDGKTDIAIFRNGEGNWYIINSSTGATSVTNWGTPGDKPVAGDYDGDLKADLAVFRPSDGNWYIRNSTGGSGVRSWGTGSDTLVPADYDGDGKTDIAIYRNSEGNWYIINSSTGVVTLRNWGLSSDIPVPGDYDGDGKSDIAVWRPSDANWYIINSNGGSVTVLNLGQAGDVPVPSAYVP